MDRREIKLMTPATVVVLLFMAGGFAVALYRMFNGLGAATNLSDHMPWGFWIGFDVLGGVAMAAGGFMIASAVYVFNMKKYRAVARPAVLTAFLGYLLAALAIFLDIGHPFRIWHPAVMWQIHSIMFIVAIHVILYTSVLAVESSPMFFEKLKWQGALRLVNRIMVPVVVFGALLSILHQSSLGAVYMLVPNKMHPLWYSTSLPFLFLVSALMMGLSMVSFESILSARAFRHRPDFEVLDGLARGSSYVLVFYFVLKLWHLVTGPGLGAAFDGSLEANMFLVEMLVGVVAPLLLFYATDARRRISGLLAFDILVITGVVVNRLNVAVVSLAREAGEHGAAYFPSWMEIVLTLGMVSVAVFAFKLAARFLRLFPETGTEA